MKRSFDPEVMRKAAEPYPELIPPDYDFQGWLRDTNNVMWEEDGNVTLACFEYPGVYTGHFFIKDGGKKAVDIVYRSMMRMVDEYGAKAFTGVTPTRLRAARLFNRRFGFTSLGIVNTERGEHEIFCMTADELKRKEMK